MIGYDKFAVVHLLSRVWLCDSTACSMPGFPVLHYLQEFAQTHIHWIRDAIQPSHPFLPASPPGSVWPGLNLSLLISFPSLHHGWSRAMEKWFSTQMFLSQIVKTMAAIIASPLCLDCTDVPTNQGSQSTVLFGKPDQLRFTAVKMKQKPALLLEGLSALSGPLRTWVTEWIRWTPPRVQDYLSQQMEIISKLGALCF